MPRSPVSFTAADMPIGDERSIWMYFTIIVATTLASVTTSECSCILEAMFQVVHSSLKLFHSVLLHCAFDIPSLLSSV
jgi:hypothetical protein